MPQSPEDPAAELPWGVTYAGRGDPEKAAAAVESALEEAGMTSCRQELGHGRLRIAGLQRAGPLAILLRALPQKIEWRIRSADGGLWVAADFHCFRWFGVVVALVALWVIAAILAADRLIKISVPSELRIPLLMAGLVSLGLVFVVPMWLGTLGSGVRAARIWRSVLREVERHGGRLEPAGREFNLRHAVLVLTYAGSLVAVTMWVMVPAFQRAIPGVAWLAIVFTMLLFSSVGFLLSIPLMSLFQRGLILRTEATIAGLVSVIAALFLCVGLPLLWQALGFHPDEQEGWILFSQAALAGELDRPLPPQELERVSQQLARLRFLARAVLAAFVLVALLGSLLWLYGVYLSIYTLYPVWRLGKHRQRRTYRRATGSRRLLRRFRLVFLPLWGLCSATVLAGCLNGWLCAFQAVVPVFRAPQLRLAELSAGLTALALGQRFDDPRIAAVVRIIWLGYGLVLLAVFLVSTGQLVQERYRERRRLARAAVSSGRIHRQLQVRLDHLCRKTALGAVTLALDPDRPQPAYAQSFGLLGRERYVALSRELVDLCQRGQLEDQELDSLLAHELAHLVQGHTLRLHRMRWLGRLTFVGDGFALAMQHTFGDELEADAKAKTLGARSEALERLLWKLSVLRTGHRLRRQGRDLAAPGLLPLSSSGEPRELGDLPWRERWRWAWRIYRQQYFHGFELQYWHPDSAWRRARLQDPEGSSLESSLPGSRGADT